MGHGKSHIRVYNVEDCEQWCSRIARELARLDRVEVLGHSKRAFEAIHEIRRCQPDIVVTDLRLLDSSGIDVLRELRNDDCKSVVIVLTNDSDSISKRRSLNAGAKYFFDKSTEIDKFVATLTVLSEQSSL